MNVRRAPTEDPESEITEQTPVWVLSCLTCERRMTASPSWDVAMPKATQVWDCPGPLSATPAIAMSAGVVTLYCVCVCVCIGWQSVPTQICVCAWAGAGYGLLLCGGGRRRSLRSLGSST